MTERLSDLTTQLRNAPPAGRFSKYAFALGQAEAKGLPLVETLDRYRHDDVMARLKAGIAAGSTAAAAWGSSLAGYDAVTREFVELTNSLSILGALEARSVRAPFNTRTIVSTSPSSATFVAPGGPIPASAVSLTDTAQLARYKIGTIRIFTQELFATAAPAAEANIRDGLALSLYRGIDSALIDPDSAGVTEQTPASLTSGVNPLGLFGATAANALSSFSTLLQAQVTAGSDLKRCVLFMHPSTLLALSLLRGTDGAITFPTLTALGGEISGIPIFATASAVRSGSPSEKLVACVDGARIVYADDGVVDLQASTVTTLEMVDNPSNSTAPVAAAMVSMSQTHSVAMKAVRYINWTKAMSSAVCWMTANY
jgi:HK97 family phage major capsid protein